MSHYHADMHGESYSMPTIKCVKCSGTCCIDCSSKGVCDFCFAGPFPEDDVNERKPPPGSWADVARMMAALSSDDDGVDWDAWKDEMKETNGQGY